MFAVQATVGHRPGEASGLCWDAVDLESGTITIRTAVRNEGNTAVLVVIDVGTTGLRAALVGDDATIVANEYRPFAPDSPFPGLVEFDAAEMAPIG